MSAASLPAAVRLPLREIKPNPDNPRVIRDEQFTRLVASLKSFPEMLALRPIVVNADRVVLGGNMRLRAAKEAGLKEVPVLIADQLTPEQQREFIVKDNASFGAWDWDVLANEWGDLPLADWGVDVPSFDEETKEQTDTPVYTWKIEAPVYHPRSETPPPFVSLVDQTTYRALLAEIELADVSTSAKEFLRLASARHLVFSYEDIAESYAHATPELQHLFEQSGLVIIDYEKAIARGFVQLTKQLAELHAPRHENDA